MILNNSQQTAIQKMHNGCILCAEVGTGKSRTALAYFFKECGGDVENPGKIIFTDLYIITTAKKRDSNDWDLDMSLFLLSTNPDLNYHKNKVVIDSWNNIKKYVEVKNSFFIFDEQRLTGSGAWVKAFYKIASKNKWIILSATPGDSWNDYIPVFVANGFYKNKTEFERDHAIYNRYNTKWPQVIGYREEEKLQNIKRYILVPMRYKKKTSRHYETIYCEYDRTMYKQLIKNRWDPWKNKPIENIAELCYLIRKVGNSDPSRLEAVIDILAEKKKAIIFYNFDYELELLMKVLDSADIIFTQWNGHKHEKIPGGDEWAYLVQYTSGAEGWNCITCDTIIFYSQNYSYKITVQSQGRIDRMNTPYTDLFYYILSSRSSIDIAIRHALDEKRDFNENNFR